MSNLSKPAAPVLRPLALLIPLLFSACGGGGDAPANGSTVTTQSVAGVVTRCVDVNANGQCDDGDITAVGNQALLPAVKQRVLQETRDAENRRVQLWVSELGQADATALSTFRAVLAASGRSALQINAAQVELSAQYGAGLNAALEKGYAAAHASIPLTWHALDSYSRAAADQKTAAPVLPRYAAAMGTFKQDASWASTEGADTRRQLSAVSSTVLNNSESNRLYLFDANADSLSSREIDLIPPPAPALAAYTPNVRKVVGWLAKATSLVVDTASAATGFANPPVPGTPVVLAPGKGIAGISLVDGGKSAFVMLNMLAGTHTADSCKGTTDGNEGLFLVSLQAPGVARNLAAAPACVHSGFTQMAANASGSRVAAWDAAAQRLWVINGATLQRISSLDLKFDGDKPPQHLAVSPGGRYLVAAGYSRAALIDLETGSIVTQLVGAWGNVQRVAFASGARRVLLASDEKLHALALDDALKLINSSTTAVAPAGQTLRGLAVSDDGDSVLVSTDSTAYWRSTATGAALASAALPAGLALQQIALASSRLVVLARGAQDQQFKLLRVPVDVSAGLQLKP